MEHHGRGMRPLRYRADDAMRTAGRATAQHTQSRHSRALAHISGGWRRRAGATGMLLVVIAATIVMAG